MPILTIFCFNTTTKGVRDVDMPVTSAVPDDPKAEEKMKELMDHLKDHVSYPASKQDIIESCNMMEHVPGEDKEWVIENLPDGMYENAGEVKLALEGAM